MKAFKTRADLEAWLEANHLKEDELWIRMFKKASGKASVDWNDCVQAMLCFGWIDGLRRSLDEISFQQRFTPRRAKSMWSKINCEHVERLIAAGQMRPAGLAQVEAAKADGRWEKAYASPKAMVLPEDFLAALKKNKKAAAFFETLSKQNHYAVYHRLLTAKREATRNKRIADFVEKLARGEKFH